MRLTVIGMNYKKNCCRCRTKTKIKNEFKIYKFIMVFTPCSHVEDNGLQVVVVHIFRASYSDEIRAKFTNNVACH